MNKQELKRELGYYWVFAKERFDDHGFGIAGWWILEYDKDEITGKVGFERYGSYLDDDFFEFISMDKLEAPALPTNQNQARNRYVRCKRSAYKVR